MPRSQKVWVIEPPKSAKRQPPSGTPETPHRPATPAQSPRLSTPTAAGGNRWRALLLAYLLGPLTVALWLEGRRRVAWAVAGVGSVLTAAVLLLWSPLATSNGVHVWLVMLPAALVAVATAWSRSVAAASRVRTIRTSMWPRWMRYRLSVGALGLLVPGLGFMIVGHRRRAACAFWILGPMAAALVVLANWRRLWEATASSARSGISGPTLEVVLLAAVGVLSLSLLAWILQALDGMRHVFASRSHAIADATGAALLVALAFFVMTFRPVALAGGLHAMATTLRLDGLRLVPLGLCEAAMRLDPATPAYIADAAELNEALGQTEAARAKRNIIEQRAKQYSEIVRGRFVAAQQAFDGSLAFRPLDQEDHRTAKNMLTWSLNQARRPGGVRPLD